MGGAIALLGVPFALGGWWDEYASQIIGMTEAPAGLRTLGLVDQLRTAGLTVTDAGDLAFSPAYRRDDDPRAKNRDLVIAALPTVTERVEQVLAAAPDGPLLALGGECTIHPAVMAGISRARAFRLALAWFDAHGDFHTTDTTPGGSIWGMPLALSCGRGDAGLVAAAGGGVVAEEDTALLGGQSVEANEAFMLASSRLAHFGSGMLATEAGMAALGAWAAAVAARVDGFYIAFDMDCLDASGNWAVTLAEPGGLALDTAVAAIRVLTDHGPIQGMGFTTVSLGSGDAPKTAAAVAELGVAAFG